MRIVIPNNGGGNQVIRWNRSKVYSIYEGVHAELTGYYDVTGPNCAVTLTMQPHQAVVLALDLLRAADSHGKTTRADVKAAIRRYAKTMERKT